MKRYRYGFTLAELLIVVAIIAVLVAIAVPIFYSNLERAREAVDLSEIRAGLERVSNIYLSMGTATPTVDHIDDRYKEVFKSSEGVYETWVKITQKTENWQTYNNDKTANFAGVDVPADILKDHWVIQFREKTQSYSITTGD